MRATDRLDRLTGLPLRARVAVALGGGAAVGLSWQPFGWWPLLLVGVPALTVAVAGVRLRRAFWLGGLHGVVMLGIGLGWIRVLGWPIAIALIVFMSLYVALQAVAIRLVSRLPAWPVWVACCWVLGEFVAGRVPFGGFGWARLGYAAVDTPLAGWFPVIGVGGVSFLAALVPHLLLAIGLATMAAARREGDRMPVGEPPPDPAARPQPARRFLQSPILAAGIVVLILLTGLGLSRFQVEPLDPRAGSVTVGIVQGNVPGRGIEAMGRARSVTNNHLSETIDLIARSRLDGQRVDFVLWPENSTDIDPTTDPLTGATVGAAARLAGVPILVGAVTDGPADDERQTTAMWWDPVAGPTATYHKRNLVPFGEWIPFRDQLLPLVPMLELVGRQSVPGTQPGALPVRLPDGRELVVGDVICFELAYDDTVADAVTAGAQVLMVQSNNATYGGTGQIEQQFAITRARAMETRREIAVATTNSVSGLIDRDGQVVFRTGEFTAASAVAALPVRSAITPALIIGPWLQRLLAAAAVVAAAVGLVLLRRPRRPRPPDGPVVASSSAGRPDDADLIVST